MFVLMLINCRVANENRWNLVFLGAKMMSKSGAEHKKSEHKKYLRLLAAQWAV
jgi:hypothetical protein